MNKLSFYLVVISGILLCFCFVPHLFLGLPEVISYQEKGLVSKEVENTFVIIWIFSSITMLLLGIWILFLAKPIKMGNVFAKAQTIIIAIGLILFWIASFYFSKELNHLFLFAVIGFMLIIATILCEKRKEKF